MAGVAELPSFPLFDVNAEPASLSPKWKKWMMRFETFLTAAAITDKTRKRAMLLYYAGEQVQDIFETFPDKGDPDDFDKAVQLLTEYFSPSHNVEYEIYIFRQSKQNPGETVDAFYTRLRQLAQNCKFNNVDKEIKSQIVLSCTSSCLRRRALREPAITLKGLLDLARAFETSELQASGMENKHETGQVAAMPNTRKKKWTTSGPQKANAEQQNQPTMTCRNCEGTFPHQGGQSACPAKGVQCRACGKFNHYARCCLSEPDKRVKQHQHGQKMKPTQSTQKMTWPNRRWQVKTILTNDAETAPISHVAAADSSTDEEYVFVTKDSEHREPPVRSVIIAGESIDVLVDSGASANLLDGKAYSILKTKLKLQQSSKRIYPYGTNTPLSLHGKGTTTVSSNGRATQATFYIALQ